MVMSLRDGVSLKAFSSPDNQHLNGIAGNIIQQYRLRLGLTMEELGDSLLVSKSMISRLESGLGRIGKTKRSVKLEELYEALQIAKPIDQAKIAFLYAFTDADILRPEVLSEHNLTEAKVINSILQDIEILSEPNAIEIESLVNEFAPLLLDGDLMSHKARSLLIKGDFKRAREYYAKLLKSNLTTSIAAGQDLINYSLALFNEGLIHQQSLFEKIVYNFTEKSVEINSEIDAEKKLLLQEYFYPALKYAEEAHQLNLLYRDALAQIALVKYSIFLVEENMDDLEKTIESFKLLENSYDNPAYRSGRGGHCFSVRKLAPLYQAQLFAYKGDLETTLTLLNTFISHLDLDKQIDLMNKSEREEIGLYFYQKAVIQILFNNYDTVEALLLKAYEFSEDIRNLGKFEILSEMAIHHFRALGREIKNIGEL